MNFEPLCCRLYATDTAIKVRGLGKKWPHRITRQLAPLDFSQEDDSVLFDMVALLGPIQEVAGQGQLVINAFRKHELRQA